MRLLLDTHAWIWWTTADPRLAESAVAVIADPANTVSFSAASAWEIAIKHALGKLPLPLAPRVYVPTRLAAQGFTTLPVTVEHALAVTALPVHHKDPFDRMLIAQASVEGLTVVTSDPLFAPYGVATLSAL
ncbi:MAG TPA: type II toxin-antitoxin system VapC family toxin [Candidatus Limnocylindria bacterium]|nr:type II toxin-antitoxin system VapC family toxin [Candidatus Limnocylindria bacterium]